MFYYVEYLRACRALRVIGIILGIILLIAVIMRLATLHAGSPDAWVSGIQHSPTAHVSRTQLAGGATRVTVDDPARHTHAVIVRNGKSFHIEVTEPSTASHDHNQMSMGSFSMNEDDRNGLSHVVADYQYGFTLPLSVLILVTLPLGLITATMLGGSLAKENEGHLELAWTKPVSRDQYALASIGVDITAIIATEIFAIGVFLVCMLMFIVPRFSFENLAVAVGLLTLGPIALYAFFTAFSASLKRGLGMVIGMGWLFGLLVPGIAETTARAQTIVGQWIHAIFGGLSYIDPLAFLSFRGNLESGAFGLTAQGSLAVLAALTFGYLALSVLQWRRVEA